MARIQSELGFLEPHRRLAVPHWHWLVKVKDGISLASSQAGSDLTPEINVSTQSMSQKREEGIPWGIDQIEEILLAIMSVKHASSLRLNRDSFVNFSLRD
jgi:hypothetical protein